MARQLVPNSAVYVLAISIILISFFSITTIRATSEEEYQEYSSFVKAIDRSTFGLKKEKPSHFRFYWHDIPAGRSPTSITVVRHPLNSSFITGFGIINMMDDPLTVGPSLSSKIVGRAQGFYASAPQQELGLLMNSAFTKGKYNGSTITMEGRNSVFNKMRELPVTGGSGPFRFARGYAEARTLKLDLSSSNVTVEYNLYVLHN